jgi:hypothetical protein
MTNTLEITPFGATSTTDDVLSGVNLKGKRILVTGVSAGLGVETARSLVAHGAQVVGAARDLNKAKAATEQVRKDAAANGGSLANAGVMATPIGRTADGFETHVKVSRAITATEPDRHAHSNCRNHRLRGPRRAQESGPNNRRVNDWHMTLLCNRCSVLTGFCKSFCLSRSAAPAKPIPV